MQSVKGRCLCGGVLFSISSPEICGHCHCSYCRLANGAAFVTWVVSRIATFEILTGRELVRWYASSEQSQRGFCERCGSSMFFKSVLCPQEIHVTRANLLDELKDLPPKFHCFADRKVSWISINDGVTALASDSEELAHYHKINPLL